MLDMKNVEEIKEMNSYSLPLFRDIQIVTHC